MTRVLSHLIMKQLRLFTRNISMFGFSMTLKLCGAYSGNQTNSNTVGIYVSGHEDHQMLIVKMCTLNV